MLAYLNNIIRHGYICVISCARNTPFRIKKKLYIYMKITKNFRTNIQSNIYSIIIIWFALTEVYYNTNVLPQEHKQKKNL